MYNYQGQKSTLSQEVEVLQREIEILQNLLGDEDPREIEARHIKLLHMYNESKDAAQAILGRLASIKQTTSSSLHEEYSLPLRD
ncbi:hypothetical protein FRC12_024543 [Ceratobasidium sp. 428]|nr:hypothetical protein FRC12_024543 [Ceratobasidium sp. 428]